MDELPTWGGTSRGQGHRDWWASRSRSSCMYLKGYYCLLAIWDLHMLWQILTLLYHPRERLFIQKVFRLTWLLCNLPMTTSTSDPCIIFFHQSGGRYNGKDWPGRAQWPGDGSHEKAGKHLLYRWRKLHSALAAVNQANPWIFIAFFIIISCNKWGQVRLFSLLGPHGLNPYWTLIDLVIEPLMFLFSELAGWELGRRKGDGRGNKGNTFYFVLWSYSSPTLMHYLPHKSDFCSPALCLVPQQMQMTSGRLHILEDQDATWCHKEAALFTLLVSVCIANLWLWVHWWSFTGIKTLMELSPPPSFLCFQGYPCLPLSISQQPSGSSWFILHLCLGLLPGDEPCCCEIFSCWKAR